MKYSKKIFISVISVIGLLLLFLVWYKYQYSMKKVDSYQINSPDLNKKLLIATQGSEFKNLLTHEIINYYKQDSIFIKVIDISGLTEINPENYNVLILIHSWENLKPPIDVKNFIERTLPFKNKIIVFTSSGQGNFKMDEVDALTGESKLVDVSFFKNKIIEKVNPFLNK